MADLNPYDSSSCTAHPCMMRQRAWILLFQSILIGVAGVALTLMSPDSLETASWWRLGGIAAAFLLCLVLGFYSVALLRCLLAADSGELEPHNYEE